MQNFKIQNPSIQCVLRGTEIEVHVLSKDIAVKEDGNLIFSGDYMLVAPKHTIKGSLKYELFAESLYEAVLYDLIVREKLIKDIITGKKEKEKLNILIDSIKKEIKKKHSY